MKNIFMSGMALPKSNGSLHIVRIMRLTICLLLLFTSFVFAENATSQNARVNLSKSKAILKEVLEEIEHQTDYLFISNLNVDLEQKVSVKANNRPVREVLNELLKNTDLTYSVEGVNIVLSRKNSSEVKQQARKKITGVVKDVNGEPIIGANVVEKGTTNGIITDMDGRFHMEVPEDAIIAVSYIGYNPQEVSVFNQFSFSVTLQEDLRTLDEVVVIGYGTVKKSDLTGSISSIEVNKIKGVSVKSVDQMLQGRSAGLYMVQSSGMPGSGSSVRIRGGNSISGGNEPLYIIDGVPVYPSTDNNQTALNPLNSIPTSDIASIEVLKDASSTAIYGSRGANGVIIITTKSGKSGKTTVSFESYLNIQNTAKEYKLLDAPTFERLSNEALVNAGGQPLYDESVTPATTDWQKLTANENALVQNYQLSLSGGNENTTFLTSFNYFDQEGIIKSTDMKKYSFRTNLNHKVSSSINLGLNLTMTKVDNNRSGLATLGNRLGVPPNVPVIDSDGEYTYQYGADAVFDNPVAIIKDRVDRRSQFRTLNNVFAEWALLKNLKLRSSFGIDIIYTTSDIYNPNTVQSGRVQGGTATKNSNNSLMWINENILTYTNTWGKHNLTGLIGFTQQSSNDNALSAGSYGYLNDILEMNNLASGTTYSAPSSSVIKWALNSYLGRVNYTFDSKYLLTMSFRADGSSRFGKNNRWGHFPSAALSWRASEEPFVKEWSIFSNLKPRISLGITGNQDGIGTYPAFSLLGSLGYPVNGKKITGYYPSQVANTNLKWESTAQYNGGVDIGFFNNRLNFVFDLYYKKTSDLLLNVTIPSSSGFTTGLKNIGQVENKGIELSVNATPLAKEFVWTTNFNITFNKNKVLNLGGLPSIFPAQPSHEDSGIQLGRIIQVGKPLGTFYGYVFDGLFSTSDDIASSAQPNAAPGDIKYKDLSGPDGVPDNTINDLDRTTIGNAQPEFFGGFTNDFSYKNFDLNVNVIFNYGNDIYNGTRVLLENMQGVGNMSAATIN
ncbi:TonB-dependent receptor [Parabacteroides sp. Marseille-P3160]|uniref:TonB-dependent receptor n=1 Tax=Parabacteroides sp. Marseille-P3160 TaxID=1917887 RepID=UPI001F293ABC|nr:TonB-dependent receptor [Parabacteroides sp. Marseille-P3160]